LDERFWLSSVDLPAEKYKLFQDQIKQEKAEKEQRLFDLRKKLSNSEMFINEAIEIARNIQYYWDSSDLQTKLKLQKTVFLKGLTRKSSDRCAFFLFSFQSTFESNQDYPTLRFGWTLGRA
jgi:hypothetical protein